MSFKIAELVQSSCYRRRTRHAAPARRDHTDVGTLSAPLFAPSVVPCVIVAAGSDLGSWCAHRDGLFAGDRAGHGTSLHELPSGVVMMLSVPVPWARRVWALPCLTALGRPAEKAMPRRRKTSVDWVRQTMRQVRPWLPERQLVLLVVDGGFAAVSLALACVKSQVAMVSRQRWDAALYHPPGPLPPGKRGPKPLKGKRQRRLQAWAEGADTPWETVELDW
jgi:hypothetical protein